MGLSFKEVAEILKIIDASECEEVVLELEGARLVVRRGGSGAPPAAGAMPATTAAPAGGAVANASAGAATSAPTATLGDGQEAVRSPMVGTFYRASDPEKPPFVEPGMAVGKGDPLCLIEVMKLFTTIEAPVDGTVASIFVENGAQVEFDQILFAIDPA